MRKEIDVVISDGTPETNRDFGKTFHIREMGAVRAEKWAMRALFIAGKSGIDIPANVMTAGFQTIAFLGIEAILKSNFADIEPLLNEIMECVTIKPDPRNPMVSRVLFDDDIEEVKTMMHLRGEILGLHMGFSIADALSKQISAASATTSPSSNTPTSPEPSVQYSQRKKRR